MGNPIRVLMITSEWPTRDQPHLVPFIVRQVEFLRKAGVEVEVFAFRGKKNPLNYARAWIQAQKMIRSGRHNLVHAQWGQSGILALPKRIPLVVTFRGDDLEGSIGQDGRKVVYGVVLKQVSKLVSKAADQVIVVSESLARSLGRKEYTTIPSGIDLARFFPGSKKEARRRLGLDPGCRYILFAGSPRNQTKRYPLAKEAVDLLPADLEARLLVATGVTHDQIPFYMNAADALLLTSLHEGSPNVVKEALACNLPVVSTNVGDVKARVKDIDGCIVVPGDTPQEVPLALESVLRRGLPVDGRKHILELDEEITTKSVIEVYQKALSVKVHGGMVSRQAREG
jgi:glycosyltransferase involved in cell wall biosynthesis